MLGSLSGDGAWTIDEFAHSCKVTRPLRWTFATCLTKCPLSFVSHYQHSSIAKDLYRNTPITPPRSPFLSPTSPFVRRTRRGGPALGLASPSSRSSVREPRTSASVTRRVKQVVNAVHCPQFPALEWTHNRHSAGEVVLLPRSSPVFGKHVAAADLVGVSIRVAPRCKQDGRKIGASSCHEVDMPANGPYQYYSLCGVSCLALAPLPLWS